MGLELAGGVGVGPGLSADVPVGLPLGAAVCDWLGVGVVVVGAVGDGVADAVGVGDGVGVGVGSTVNVAHPWVLLALSLAQTWWDPLLRLRASGGICNPVALAWQLLFSVGGG
jgi:hypothetical protein